MATFTERLALLIDAKTGGAIREINSLNNTIDKTGTAQTQTATKTSFLQQQMHNLGLTGSATGAMLSHAMGVIAVAGVGGLVAATKQGIDKQIELADSVRRVVAVSGLSAEQSSRLVEVTGDYGIAASTTERALLRLGTQVNNNANFEKQYGVEIARNKDDSVDLVGTLENVQKAYKGQGDQAEKNAMIMGIFGRAGKELIPVLRETGSLAQALADVPESRILSDDDLRKAREYTLAMDDFHDVLDAFQRELAMAVIPALSKFIESLNTSFEALNKIANPVGGLGSAMNFLLEHMSPLAPALHGASAASELFSGHYRNATDQILQSIPVLGEGASAIGHAVGIFKSGSDDVDKMAEATKRYHEAQAEVARLAESGKDQELAAAKKELHAAQKDLASSTNAVAEAMKTENEQNQEAINLTYQRLGGVLGLRSADLAYAAAQDNVESAHLKVADANAKVFAAEATLNELRAQGKTGSMEYAEAQRNLEEAHLGVNEAQRGVAQSDVQLVQAGLNVEGQVRSLRDQVKNNKLSWDEYQARIEDLKTKYPGLASAIDNVSGSVRILHGNVDELPNYKDIQIHADTSAARWAIGDLAGAVDWATRARLIQVKIATTMANNYEAFYQHGGPVPGGVNDPYPAVLHGGEYVLSADVVERIKAGRKSRGAMVDGGRPWTGYSDSSTNGGGQFVIPITLTMDGEVVTDVVVRRVSDRSRGGPVFPASSVMTRG